MTNQLSKKHYLSKSKVTTYEKCPLSYKFGYIDKVGGGNIYTQIGSDVHDFIELLFEVIEPQSDGSFLNVSKLPIAPNEDYKRNVILFEHERWKRILDKGLDDSYFFPVYCENKYYIDDNEIVGIVDRVHKCHKDDMFAPKHPEFKDGAYVIVENKTGKFSKQKASDYEEELLWYRYILRETQKIDMRWGCIYFPLTNKCHYIDLNEPKFSIDKLKEKITLVRGLINDSVFIPKPEPDKCFWCFYNDICIFKAEKDNK